MRRSFVCVSFLIGLSELTSTFAAAPAPNYEFDDGRWWDGTRFVAKTMYSVDGVLRDRPPAHLDEVIDLEGGYVIPPFAEGHNHWLEASKTEEYSQCYLANGIYYVRDMSNSPYILNKFRDRVNLPTSVDFETALQGFSAPGGHPAEIVDQFVSFGILPKSPDPDENLNAFFAVTTEQEIDKKFEQLRRENPAYVKAFLLYSEEYVARLHDPAQRGNGRGMDPKLLPHLVKIAHAAGLKVAVHIETASDFHSAVAARADDIAHFPGMGYRADNYPLDRGVGAFQITREDARAAARAGVRVTTTLSWMIQMKQEKPEQYDTVRDQIIVPNLRLLVAAGVPILIGSDQFRQTVIPEILQVRELGVFSNAELLKMATTNTTKAIFPTRKLGELKDGYEADFVVLKANPVENLNAIRSIGLRVKQGRRLLLPEAILHRGDAACVEGSPGP